MSDAAFEIFWEQFFASVALVLWSVQLLPQIYKNYKRENTKELSPHTFLIWCVSNVLVSSNSIINNASILIIIQPHLFNFLSMICYIQCYYYNKLAEKDTTNKESKDSKLKHKLTTLLYFVILFLIFGAIEFFILLIFFHYNLNQHLWLHYMFGSLGPIIVILGFIPQYIHILKNKNATGISLLFIYLDLIGGISALISLSYHQEFQFTVALTYIGVMCSEVGLLIFKFYYDFDKFKLDLLYFRSKWESLFDKNKLNKHGNSSKNSLLATNASISTITTNLGENEPSSIVLPIYLGSTHTLSNDSNSNFKDSIILTMDSN